MNKCITQDGENQPVKYNFDILKNHDQKGHDQKDHDQKDHDQKDHDQKGHDQKDHDQKDHDQKDHDHYTLALMVSNQNSRCVEST